MVCRRLLLVCLLLLSLLPRPLPAAGAEAGADKVGQGKALLASGRYQDACALFFAFFRNDPANPEVNFYLGRAAFASGDYETAVMAYERVLIADPTAVTAKLELAKSFYRLGAEATAAGYFRELLAGDLTPEVRASVEGLLATIDGGER